jgi:MinD-like ATPase involved in chromosome partitioning or flagellar assembly
VTPVPLIAVGSVKGSPGVTTTCLALAAAWPAPRRLVIEADPAGGDLGPWLGLPPAPGLTGLAAAARHDHGSDVAWQHAQEIAGGLSVVIAPAGAEQASACLAALAGNGGPVFAALAGAAETVIADCGRLDPGSPALAIAAQADVTLVLVRPRVSDLSHLALRTDGLSRAGARLALLLAPDAGRGPAEASYPAGEIAATLNIPVQASVPADPRGAVDLVACRGELHTPRRAGPLARAAASLAAALAAGPGQQPPPPAAAPGPARVPARPAAEVTAGDTPR